MNIKLIKSSAKIMIISAFIILIISFFEIINSFKAKYFYSELGVNLWLFGITIGLIGSIILFICSLSRIKKEKIV